MEIEKYVVMKSKIAAWVYQSAISRRGMQAAAISDGVRVSFTRFLVLDPAQRDPFLDATGNLDEVIEREHSGHNGRHLPPADGARHEDDVPCRQCEKEEEATEDAETNGVAEVLHDFLLESGEDFGRIAQVWSGVHDNSF